MYKASRLRKISDLANNTKTIERKIEKDLLQTAKSGSYKQYIVVPTKNLNTVVDDLTKIGYCVVIDNDYSDSKSTSVIVQW